MRPIVPLLVLSTVILSGCLSPSPAEQRAGDENTCRSYGFRPRTVAFSECLQRIDLSRDADRRARRYGDPYFRSGVGIGIGTGRYGSYW